MTDRDLPEALALVQRLQPALDRSDRATITDIIAQLVALRASMGEQWESLAYYAAAHGELSLARQAMDLLVSALGGGPLASFRKASILSQLGAWREADALLRTLPENVPDSTINAYCRGLAALHLGNRDEAQRYLDRVTQIWKQSGVAWFSLALSVDFSNEPGLADRLVAAERGMTGSPLNERVCYFYALGKMHAVRGEHRLAFDAFAHGARLMKPAAGYDRARDRSDAARAIDGYSAARIAAIAREQREPTDRTLFVTGLPRSGTTLVEQILTGHSKVSDGGETGFPVMLAAEVGSAAYPTLARYVEANGTASVTQLWHHWLDERFPAPGRVVEKTIDVSRYLGLAAALLPEAPLIWVTRDPLDRAWSCFRTNFAANALPWSHDLGDIAAHFRLEDQLLEQWQQVLGDRLLVLSYESLVTDPGRWIRRILAHCGLAEEPAVFAPHQNPRPVTTSSMVQVRRPINRDGIGAAEPYREFLEPFLQAYYG